MATKQTATKRATIYLESKLYKALRVKAAVNEKSVSYLVNMAIKDSLENDVVDILDLEKRKLEPNLDYIEVRKKLKKLGKL